MGKALGGYVRRSERVQAPRLDPIHVRPFCLPWPRPEPPVFQCMPFLRFEHFDVRDDVDNDGMPGLGSSHGHRTGHPPDRTRQHGPGR